MHSSADVQSMYDYLVSTERAGIASAADGFREHLRPDDNCEYDEVSAIAWALHDHG